MEYAIFASNARGLVVEDAMDTMSIPYRRLQGGCTMDDGTLVVETSWLVPLGDLQALRDLWSDQESVMVLGELLHKPQGCRPAALYFPADGSVVRLGVLRQVDRETALASPGWSHDSVTGEYWTAKPI